MNFLLFVLLVLLAFTSSALLVCRFVMPAKTTVAGISFFILLLCNLIVPVHCIALFNLLGLGSFLRIRTLFLLAGSTFLCVLGLFLFRRKHGQLRLAARSRSYLHLPLHVALGLVVTLCVYGILCAKMAFSFPDSWDAVAYHYPVALRWLQEGTLRIAGDSAWRASLPGNVEILDLLVLLTGRERLLGSVQWPGLLILILACAYLSHRLGESKAAVWPVVTTILMIPMVATQAISGYVDLFGSALLFGSLALVIEFYDQAVGGQEAPHYALILIAGLGCGLAAGSKPIFWLYAAILMVNTFIMMLWLHRKLPKQGWNDLALFLIGAAIPSLFWFYRATMCTGNPFYPLAIHIGSWSLTGVATSAITATDFYLENARHWTELFVYPWTEWKRHPSFLLINYGPGDGLGGGFATFAIPGALFALWLSVKRRTDLRLWFANLFVLWILWWFLLHKVFRFGLPIIILTVILSVPLFEVLELEPTRAYKLLYISVFVITACALSFSPIYTIIRTMRYGLWNRSAYWSYPTAIDTLRPGSKVLSLCEPTLNFALAGSGLSNRVIPNWERPDQLTEDFLRLHEVNYVVERSMRENADQATDKGPPVKGLEIYFSGSIPQGGEMADWKIWKVSP